MRNYNFGRFISFVFITLLVSLLSSLVYGDISKGWDCEKKYLSQIIKENYFNTSRGLKLPAGPSVFSGSYFRAFGKRFKRELFSLKSDQVWIDMGAGEGKAIAEYYEDGGVAQSFAVVVEPAGGLQNIIDQERRSKLISGRYIENTNVSYLYNQVELITDFFGPISYTLDIAKVLNKYFKLLKINGSIYFRARNDVPVVKLSETVLITLKEFLESIDGIKVVSHSKKVSSGIKLIKTKHSVTIPRLELLKMNNDTPPHRIFSLLD